MEYSKDISNTNLRIKLYAIYNNTEELKMDRYTIEQLDRIEAKIDYILRKEYPEVLEKEKKD
jgi:hypothetical protein